MKVKTSELTGAALDWAVLEAEDPKNPHNVELVLEGDFDGPYQYSNDWALAGPIIESEKMHGIGYHGEWYAEKFIAKGKSYKGIGSTPLVAAMRCFVTSKMGDEVDVPEELL